MLRQLAPNEWIENGSEVPLCQLPLSVADVEHMRPVRFAPLEPQLPDYSHAVVSIDGQVYLLAGAREALHDSVHSFVSVYSRGDVRDPSTLVEHVCAEFGISRQDLKWLSSDLSPRAWLLWRLDDNGNQEPMWYFKEARFAEAVAKFYTDRGHKQLYFVESAA
jgi:hypothetical protein